MAMLWVMLFHADHLSIAPKYLAPLGKLGFGGVDVFIVLSSMGLSMSLLGREQEYGSFLARRVRRILPAYYTVVIPWTLWNVSRSAVPLSTLFWNVSLLYYRVRSQGGFNW